MTNVISVPAEDGTATVDCDLTAKGPQLDVELTVQLEPVKQP